MSSRVYDSRASDRPGWGFPSCDTALCRLPRNRADPHGYYAELQVDPAAAAGEIRAAARRLYRRFHPDTGTQPDAGRLQRVKLIAEVLLDPEQRERYNRTPPGKRLLDGLYRSQLSALDLSGLDRAELAVLLKGRPPPPTRPRAGGWFDYLAVDRRAGDMHLAQRWYTCLVGAAPLVGYRGRIKVLLRDGGSPSFDGGSRVMAVPRSWRPSRAAAFALLTVTAGMRHPAWRTADGHESGVVSLSAATRRGKGL